MRQFWMYELLQFNLSRWLHVYSPFAFEMFLWKDSLPLLYLSISTTKCHFQPQRLLQSPFSCTNKETTPAHGSCIIYWIMFLLDVVLFAVFYSSNKPKPISPSDSSDSSLASSLAAAAGAAAVSAAAAGAATANADGSARKALTCEGEGCH